MSGDPLVNVACLIGLLVLGWRWLHRSPHVRPPSWFMRPVDPPRPFTIIHRPYDWERDA